MRKDQRPFSAGYGLWGNVVGRVRPPERNFRNPPGVNMFAVLLELCRGVKWSTIFSVEKNATDDSSHRGIRNCTSQLAKLRYIFS
jgi:hypothetical protein